MLDAVLGNVGTHALFRVGPEDAALLGKVMRPRVAPDDVAGLRDYAAFVRSVGGLGNVPFSLRSLPPPPGADPARAQAIRELSRRRHTRPWLYVDAEIAQAMEVLDGLGSRGGERGGEKRQAEASGN